MGRRTHLRCPSLDTKYVPWYQVPARGLLTSQAAGPTCKRGRPRQTESAVTTCGAARTGNQKPPCTNGDPLASPPIDTKYPDICCKMAIRKPSFRRQRASAFERARRCWHALNRTRILSLRLPTSYARSLRRTHVFRPTGAWGGERGQPGSGGCLSRQSWADRGSRSASGDLGRGIPAPILVVQPLVWMRLVW